MRTRGRSIRVEPLESRHDPRQLELFEVHDGVARTRAEHDAFLDPERPAAANADRK